MSTDFAGHTPGPWKPEDGVNGVFTSQDGTPIGQVFDNPDTVGYDDAGNEPSHYNFLLCVAAPDLLKERDDLREELALTKWSKGLDWKALNAAKEEIIRLKQQLAEKEAALVAEQALRAEAHRALNYALRSQSDEEDWDDIARAIQAALALTPGDALRELLDEIECDLHSELPVSEALKIVQRAKAALKGGAL
jgi:hypothetical protein